MAAPTELLDELLVAIGAGDPRAFRRLYEATSDRLLGILIAQVGRRDLAEDILQESFIKIWQKARSYDPERGRAMPWLIALVRNQAVDLIRRRRPDEDGEEFDSFLATWTDDAADPQRDVEHWQGMSRLLEPLAALAPQVRTSVLLTCYAGYTHVETAGLMQAPLGTLKSWVRRGLDHLRRDVAAAGIDAPLYGMD